jgi:hydrogenase maturation factor
MNAKPEYLALTLNIHKGFSASNLRYTLEALRVAPASHLRIRYTTHPSRARLLRLKHD